MNVFRTAAVLTAVTLVGAGAAMAQATTRRPASRTPHTTADKAECLTCHGPGANAHVTSVPEAHRFTNAQCTTCHRPAETMPPSSQHALDAAHARCAVCHVAGSPTHAKAPPATHAAYHASTCRMCHQSAAPH